MLAVTAEALQLSDQKLTTSCCMYSKTRRNLGTWRQLLGGQRYSFEDIPSKCQQIKEMHCKCTCHHSRIIIILWKRNERRHQSNLLRQLFFHVSISGQEKERKKLNMSFPYKITLRESIYDGELCQGK